jgi:hypothetical protein
MTMRLIFLMFCLAVLPRTGAARLAEVICDDSARLENQLLVRHGAQKQGQGMRGPDAILEVWIAPSTGDWTVVQTYANGTSCIVAMGEHWEMFGPEADPA